VSWSSWWFRIEKKDKNVTEERVERWTKDGGHGRERRNKALKSVEKVVALVSLNKN
jgi:hypothetical protein